REVLPLQRDHRAGRPDLLRGLLLLHRPARSSRHRRDEPADLGCGAMLAEGVFTAVLRTGRERRSLLAPRGPGVDLPLPVALPGLTSWPPRPARVRPLTPTGSSPASSS